MQTSSLQRTLGVLSLCAAIAGCGGDGGDGGGFLPPNSNGDGDGDSATDGGLPGGGGTGNNQGNGTASVDLWDFIPEDRPAVLFFGPNSLNGPELSIKHPSEDSTLQVGYVDYDVVLDRVNRRILHGSPVRRFNPELLRSLSGAWGAQTDTRVGEIAEGDSPLLENTNGYLNDDELSSCDDSSFHVFPDTGQFIARCSHELNYASEEWELEGGEALSITGRLLAVGMHGHYLVFPTGAQEWPIIENLDGAEPVAVITDRDDGRLWPADSAVGRKDIRALDDGWALLVHNSLWLIRYDGVMWQSAELDIDETASGCRIAGDGSVWCQYPMGEGKDALYVLKRYWAGTADREPGSELLVLGVDNGNYALYVATDNHAIGDAL